MFYEFVRSPNKVLWWTLQITISQHGLTSGPPDSSCKLAEIFSNISRNRLSCLGVNLGSSIGTLGWHETLEYVGINNALIQCAGLAKVV